jgi:hypothetical protein
VSRADTYLACPLCGSTSLATHEDVDAAALCYINGEGGIEWEGTTEYGDGESQTDESGNVLIQCRSCYADWTLRVEDGEGRLTYPATDSRALDALARMLDGREWEAGDLDTVCQIIRETGRTVRDTIQPDDYGLDDRKEQQ